MARLLSAPPAVLADATFWLALGTRIGAEPNGFFPDQCLICRGRLQPPAEVILVSEVCAPPAPPAAISMAAAVCCDCCFGRRVGALRRALRRRFGSGVEVLGTEQRPH